MDVYTGNSKGSLARPNSAYALWSQATERRWKEAPDVMDFVGMGQSGSTEMIVLTEMIAVPVKK